MTDPKIVDTDDADQLTVRRQINKVRICARDRFLAAVHEAGHIAIARKVGAHVTSAWIAPEPHGGIYEKTWIGRTEIALLNRSLAIRRRRMIGVAGAVAELRARGEIEDGDGYDPSAWYEPEAMSESDWKLAGCTPGDPDDACLRAIQTVVKLTARRGRLWPVVIREARRLIVESRYAHGSRHRTSVDTGRS